MAASGGLVTKELRLDPEKQTTNVANSFMNNPGLIRQTHPPVMVPSIPPPPLPQTSTPIMLPNIPPPPLPPILRQPAAPVFVPSIPPPPLSGGYLGQTPAPVYMPSVPPPPLTAGLLPPQTNTPVLVSSVPPPPMRSDYQSFQPNENSFLLTTNSVPPDYLQLTTNSVPQDYLQLTTNSVPQDYLQLTTNSVPQDYLQLTTESVHQDYLQFTTESVHQDYLQLTTESVPQDYLQLTTKSVPQDYLQLTTKSVPQDSKYKSNDSKPAEDMSNQFKYRMKKFASENPDSAKYLNDLLLTLQQKSAIPSSTSSPLSPPCQDVKKLPISLSGNYTASEIQTYLNSRNENLLLNKKEPTSISKAILTYIADLTKDFGLLSKLSALSESTMAGGSGLSALEDLLDQAEKAGSTQLKEWIISSPTLKKLYSENQDFKTRTNEELLSSAKSGNLEQSQVSDHSSRQSYLSFDYNHQHSRVRSSNDSHFKDDIKNADKQQQNYDRPHSFGSQDCGPFNQKQGSSDGLYDRELNQKIPPDDKFGSLNQYNQRPSLNDNFMEMSHNQPNREGSSHQVGDWTPDGSMKLGTDRNREFMEPTGNNNRLNQMRNIDRDDVDNVSLHHRGNDSDFRGGRGRRPRVDDHDFHYGREGSREEGDYNQNHRKSKGYSAEDQDFHRGTGQGERDDFFQPGSEGIQGANDRDFHYNRGRDQNTDDPIFQPGRDERRNSDDYESHQRKNKFHRGDNYDLCDDDSRFHRNNDHGRNNRIDDQDVRRGRSYDVNDQDFYHGTSRSFNDQDDRISRNCGFNDKDDHIGGNRSFDNQDNYCGRGNERNVEDRFQGGDGNNFCDGSQNRGNDQFLNTGQDSFNQDKNHWNDQRENKFNNKSNIESGNQQDPNDMDDPQDPNVPFGWRNYSLGSSRHFPWIQVRKDGEKNDDDSMEVEASMADGFQWDASQTQKKNKHRHPRERHPRGPFPEQ